MCAGLMLAGCWHDPMPHPPERPAESADGERTVLLEPLGDPLRAPTAPRFVVTPAANEQIPPASLWLFTGELSSYYATRVARGELPDALVERQVPTLAWLRGSSVVVSPTQALPPGAPFTLAALGVGPVLSILVAPDAPLAWSRLWPPLDAPSGAAYAVYCGGPPALTEPVTTTLEPDAIAAQAEPGADDLGTASERCLRVVPLEGPVGTLIPPPMVGRVPLDPAPLGSDRANPVAPRDCGTSELRFGPGCGTVEDDRVLLRVPDEALLWIVRGLPEPVVEAVPPGGGLTLLGFGPNSRAALELTTVDLSGSAAYVALDVYTSSPRPHVVINEVLANPVGPEPAEEWVELLNTGTVDVDLEGYTLRDSTAATALPAETLPRGAFALVVRPDYVADSLGDTPPAPGTLLLRVPEIGNGLSNSGEALRLEDAGGHVLSSFPAIAQPRPGVCAVRRGPAAWDDDPAAFGLGECSPGAPNPPP
jgi:hypothetical protein